MTPAPAPTVGGARFNNPLDDVSRWEPHQPALLYELLDVKMYGADDLPARNLVSALIGLESSRTPGELERWLDALLGWVRGPGERELRRAFGTWTGSGSSSARQGPNCSTGLGTAQPELGSIGSGRQMPIPWE